MAKSKHDGKTYDWAEDLADKLLAKFDRTWWYQAASQYADSLIDPGNVQSFQQYWIGQTPMEAELNINGVTVPGVAPYRPRQRRAGRPGERLLQRHPAVQHRPVPHRLQRTAERSGREGHLRPDHLDPVGRRGQLRPARPGPAAALPGRADPDHVRRAGHRRHPGRAAGRHAGDLPVPGSGRQHRPVLDLPLDVHAGLGQLRHRLAGRAPVAGCAAEPGQPRAGRRSAGPTGANHHLGSQYPAGQRLGGRVGQTTPARATSPRSARTARSAPGWSRSAAPCRAARTRRRSTWTGT